MIKFANNKNEVERQIAVVLVEDILAQGYTISVNDGEDTTLKESTDETAIFEAMCSTDHDYLIVHGINKNFGDAKSGWIMLVWGNGCDLISDYTVNMPEAVMIRADELAETFNR